MGDPGVTALFLSSNTSDLETGILVVTGLMLAWHYRVNAGTGGPSVSVL